MARYPALLIIATIAILGVALQVNAQPTCSDCTGSVYVTWSGPNCAGGVAEASQMVPNPLFKNNSANTCFRLDDDDDDSGMSTTWRCSGSDIVQDQYFSACTGIPFTTIRTHTGLCVNTKEGSSAAYFCSRQSALAATSLTLSGGNGTVPPGTPFPGDDVSEPIQCPDGKCPYGYMYSTAYADSTCSSNELGTSYIPATRMGVCFNSSLTSVKYGCERDNVVTYNYFGGGCDTKPITTAYIPTGKCLPLIAGFYVKNACSPASMIIAPLQAIFALIAAFMLFTLF